MKFANAWTIPLCLQQALEIGSTWPLVAVRCSASGCESRLPDTKVPAASWLLRIVCSFLGKPWADPTSYLMTQMTGEQGRLGQAPQPLLKSRCDRRTCVRIRSQAQVYHLEL